MEQRMILRKTCLRRMYLFFNFPDILEELGKLQINYIFLHIKDISTVECNLIIYIYFLELKL